MTLDEMIVGVLAQMHRPYDGATMDEWRTRIKLYLNEALCDLTAALRPWRRETVRIEGGCVNTALLSRHCIKVLELCVDGRRRTFFYNGRLDCLGVPGIISGEAVLCYRYMPPALENPDDTPDLPAECHPLLVTYAVARERTQWDGQSLNGASAGFALYEAQRGRVRKTLGEPLGYGFFNKGGEKGE